MARLGRTLAAALTLLLLLGPVAGCGEDTDPADGTLEQDAAETDTNPVAIDTRAPEPCEGQGSQEGAETYNHQCEEITGCEKDMPEQPGPCYCKVCGPKGTKIVCLQIICPQRPGS